MEEGKSKLKEARVKLPQIQARQCDLSKKEDRESFCDWVRDNHEGLNILVNNAGIQRAIDLRKGTVELFGGEDEVQINFSCSNSLVGILRSVAVEEERGSHHQRFLGPGFRPDSRHARLLRHQGGNPYVHRIPEAPVKGYLC